MIGAFARKFSGKADATEVEVDEKVMRYRAASGEVREDKDADSVPEHFTEKIAYDGGDVVYVPLLEALRNVLRGKRK